MEKFRFRKFPIYKESHRLRREIKLICQKYFPKEEIYSLTIQLMRALNSIILNIAEGSDRGTDKDFAYFLNNSHTSLNEVVACLDIALVDKYISGQIHQLLLEKAEALANQLTAFRKSLLESPTK